MARANLSALLGNVEDPTSTLTSSAVAPASPPAASADVPPKLKPGTVAKENPVVADDAEPLYLRLVRKEARLREEQYSALTEHARRLSRARRGQGARITENTLIRIAVDLLLERIDGAVGVDERELRESIR